MKKIIFTVLLGATMLNLKAQLEVTTSNLDLSAIVKNDKEYWKMYSGQKDANGDLVLKIGNAKAGFGGLITGAQFSYGSTRLSSSQELETLTWTFQELHFDNSLKFKNAETKAFQIGGGDYAGHRALAQYAPVYGNFLFPNSFQDINLVLGNSFHNDYLDTRITIPSTPLFAQKITDAHLAFFPNFVVGSKRAQLDTRILKGSESKVEGEKGDKWAVNQNFIEPGAGVILFRNLKGGADFFSYKINRYEGGTVPKKSKIYKLPYVSALTLVQIAKADGGFDYAVVAQTTKKYASKDMEVKPADHAEIFILDGKTLEEKQKATFTLPYTQWLPRHASYAPNGSVLVWGAAGKDNKEYALSGFAINENKMLASASGGLLQLNTPDKFPNLVTVVVKGNQATANGASVKDAQALTTVLSGSPYKIKNTPIFTAAFDKGQSTLGLDPKGDLHAAHASAEGTFPFRGNAKAVIGQQNVFAHYAGDKVVVSFEAFVERTGDNITGNLDKVKLHRNGWATMILDANGKLEKYFYMPTNGFATSDQLFSADKKTMYWAVYDPNSLNKTLHENGLYESKSIKNMIAAELLLAKIDLAANSTSNVQVVGGKDFALNAEFPLVADTDSEIIFQGKSLGKSAKDSELVLVKVKK